MARLLQRGVEPDRRVEGRVGSPRNNCRRNDAAEGRHPAFTSHGGLLILGKGLVDRGAERAFERRRE
jgi:hypothetical protein